MLEKLVIPLIHFVLLGFLPLARMRGSAHPAYAAYEAVYEEAYRVMRARGTRTCAVSAPLLERLAPSASAAVVPNGIDPAEWLHPAPPPARAFERAGRQSRRLAR